MDKRKAYLGHKTVVVKTMHTGKDVEGSGHQRKATTGALILRLHKGISRKYQKE